RPGRGTLSERYPSAPPISPRSAPMRYSLLAVVALVVPGSSAAVRADEPARPMPELTVLEQMVGTWDEVVTHKPAEWTPQGGTQKAVTKKGWALGGRFLRMEGTWQPEKTEFV